MVCILSSSNNIVRELTPADDCELSQVMSSGYERCHDSMIDLSAVRGAERTHTSAALVKTIL